MQYFKNYVSNTLAGSSMQHFFESDNKSHTGRVFYKVFLSGEFQYSLLFSNIIDSTYDDGSISHKNLVLGSWQIESMRLGVCESINNNIPDSAFRNVTFNGETSKTVNPGEFFSTDPVTLNVSDGGYICLETTFKGQKIPYHEENIISAYTLLNNEWVLNNHTPFASMVGIKRAPKLKIGYLGDSITQGIGTKFDSYEHWCAELSNKLGPDYSYWNLGIGYARANDAASDGAWLYKVKQNDLVFVCLGVNDILQGNSEEQIKNDLTTIVNILKNEGKKVILQTIPPFNYSGEKLSIWNNLNHYINNELASKVDLLFDSVEVLCESSEHPQNAKYGPHPNEEGTKIWANKLYFAVKDFVCSKNN